MNQGRSTNAKGAGRDEYFDIKPNDIVISVMGLTGVGKSTFINHFSDRPAPVGRNLVSCTNRVDVYKCSDHRLGEFYLVDTPGFDDTHRTDTDVLREVTGWLNRAYKQKILLAGIIYLHRIFDNRVGGSAMRNLRSFKRLCGDDALSKVVLATTMWGMIDEDSGKRHERELKEKPDFWGSMIAKGSRVFRQDKDKESARDIIKYLVNKRNTGSGAMALDVQRQMVDQKMRLDQTGAGREMEGQLATQRAEYERKLDALRQELRQAIRDNDESWQSEIKKLERETKQKNEQAQADKQKLRADNAELKRRLDKQEAAENKEREREHDRQRQILVGLEYEMKMMGSRVASEEEQRKLRDELQEARNKHEMLRWKIRQSQARCTVM